MTDQWTTADALRDIVAQREIIPHIFESALASAHLRRPEVVTEIVTKSLRGRISTAENILILQDCGELTPSDMSHPTYGAVDFSLQKHTLKLGLSDEVTLEKHDELQVQEHMAAHTLAEAMDYVVYTALRYRAQTITWRTETEDFFDVILPQIWEYFGNYPITAAVMYNEVALRFWRAINKNGAFHTFDKIPYTEIPIILTGSNPYAVSFHLVSSKVPAVVFAQYDQSKVQPRFYDDENAGGVVCRIDTYFDAIPCIRTTDDEANCGAVEINMA